jgi:hypothetical protein
MIDIPIAPGVVLSLEREKSASLGSDLLNLEKQLEAADGEAN